MKIGISRRDAVLLGAAAPLVVACTRAERAAPRPIASPAFYGLAEAAPAKAPAPRGCAATEASIEGPYYRPNAPERVDLSDASTPGIALEIAGRVTTIDCATPLAGAELDLWQANASGHYDNDGTAPPGRTFLRGKVQTDADGRWRVRTIVPGRYLNGRQYRPAHVHVKVRASGHLLLTTQLYFPDDPYNDVDPFLHRSLIMEVRREGEVLRATYDFALRRA
jgi:protocatechuate 3,4-dioxygenase beta subunit